VGDGLRDGGRRDTGALVDPSLEPKTLGGLIGIVGTVGLGMFTAITQWRKGNIDASANVMGEWQKLIAAHQTQIKGLVEEISDLRTRLAVAEKEIMELRAENAAQREHAADEIRRRDETIAGLTRTIAQNSQSNVAFLEPSATDRAPTAAARFAPPRPPVPHNRRKDDE
jgi:hypothetical protein